MRRWLKSLCPYRWSDEMRIECNGLVFRPFALAADASRHAKLQGDSFYVWICKAGGFVAIRENSSRDVEVIDASGTVKVNSNTVKQLVKLKVENSDSSQPRYALLDEAIMVVLRANTCHPINDSQLKAFAKQYLEPNGVSFRLIERRMQAMRKDGGIIFIGKGKQGSKSGWIVKAIS